MSGVNLDAIYQRLQSIPRYHPMSANTFADWAMEAGDIVTVKRDGTGYASPVGTMTLKWNGKQQIQISTEGSRERDSISKVSARKYARGAGGSSGIRSDRELYWEMSSEDGLVHASIHATAESLTTDYSKKISDQNIELRGVITSTAEALTSDYTKKIGDTNTTLRGVIQQTAASLTSDYTRMIGEEDVAMRSHVAQTAEQINTSIENLETRLSTRINETDSTVSLAVGKVKYSSVQNYANKTSFPSTGTAGVLYHANDTGIDYLYMPGTHSYEKAKTDEYGNANFIKAGEIAITINESGDTEAKLDAKVVYAGANTKETLAGLELPDWMYNTEGQIDGLVASKATVVDLRALRARVDTLETNSLMTKNLSAAISNLSLVTVKGLKGGNITSDGYIESDTVRLKSGAQHGLAEAFIGVQLDGPTNNQYTLKFLKADGEWYSIQPTFSRATSLSGAWSGGVYTVTASPQGNTRTIGFSSNANEYLVLYGKSGEYVYTNPSTGVADYHYLYKPTAVGTGNSSGPPTERHTDDLLVDATLSYDAGYDAGWSTARGKVSIPGQGSGSSITPAWPSATTGEQESRTYEFYSDSNNNVVLRYNTAGSGQQPSYVTAASFNHGKYNAGWNEGGKTAKVNTIYGVSSLPEGESSMATLAGYDSYYQITPAYVNSSGVTTASENLAYFKTPYDRADGTYWTYTDEYSGDASKRYTVYEGSGSNAKCAMSFEIKNSKGEAIYSGVNQGPITQAYRDGYAAGYAAGGGGATHSIDIPSRQIYTSGTSRGTNLTTLKRNYEQAKSDSEFVMFRVDCGDETKWYYMEP